MARINNTEFVFVYYDPAKGPLLWNSSKLPVGAEEVQLVRAIHEHGKWTWWGNNHKAQVEAMITHNNKCVGYLLKDHIGYPWFFATKLRLVR